VIVSFGGFDAIKPIYDEAGEALGSKLEYPKN
jgi:hypothetical protein